MKSASSQPGLMLSDVARVLRIKPSSELADRRLISLTSDSREVKSGSLFVAVRGTAHDGHDFVAQARRLGALAVVGETAECDFRVPNSALALAHLASAFYGHPSRAMKMVGVTGTSGKTTTAFLIESILSASGLQPGLIGTVVFRQGGNEIPSTHTTPGAVELQALLAQMRDAGAKAVVMEVSSHALHQHRASAIAWDVGVFNNLSPEHLDYHKDLEDYFQAKRLLFTDGFSESREAGKNPVGIFNGGDLYGQRLADEFSKNAQASYQVFKVLDGLKASLSGMEIPFDRGNLKTSLVGRFNAENVLAAATAASALGVPAAVIAAGIENLKGVPGRLEPVGGSKIHVFVDYAHKPDALEKVLSTLVAMKGTGRIITVMGCGGDRDRQKRPKMGAIAEKLSDRLWITSDNPRTENPQAIIDEILGGLRNRAGASVEPDRALAIRGALSEANDGDVVLIAGKGHEHYQIVGKDKFPFDDREVASSVLRARNSLKR